jgi:peroxiredoxin
MSFGGQSQQRWGDNTINQNEMIRDLQLTDLSGRVCHTGPARSKGLLLLAFFRADSAPSLASLTALQALADGYKESGKLTVFGVSESDEAATRSAVAAAGASFSVLLDRDGYHAMVYGLTSVPTVYLVGSDGTVLRKMIGFQPRVLTDISARIAAVVGVEEPVDPLAVPVAAA